jgi:beta-glucosidase-like glycosyl hydrolase/CubicO group peptidase (beta-lactamase class C family)
MIWAGGQYVSAQSDEDDRLRHAIGDLGIGGIVLRQSDVYETAVRLNALQERATVPLLIAADLERGLAMRVRRGTPFPDAMAIGATRNPRLAYEAARAVAEEARALGIHQTFGPVADVNTNPLNPVINTRAFGDDPALVRDMVRASVRGTADGGVLATVKHFPGHGGTGVDSHVDLPVITDDASRIDTLDMAAFHAALEEGVPSVMVAHVALPAVDSVRSVPASLSTRIIGGLLRRDLHYDGLVVTDALEMRSITGRYSPARAPVLALKAGADVVLVPPDPDAAKAAILQAVATGDLAVSRLDEAVLRILRAKRLAGLDRARTTDIGAIGERVGTRDHFALARSIARESMTLLRNDDGVVPLGGAGRRRVGLVVVTEGEESRSDVHRPQAAGSNEPTGTYFTALLRDRLPRLDVVRLHGGSEPDALEAAARLVRQSDVCVIALYVRVRSSGGRLEMPRGLAPFIRRLEQGSAKTVVVSCASPYVVGLFPRAQGVLCAYGENEPAAEAAVAVLLGDVQACGRLPVSVGGTFPFGSGLPCADDRLHPGNVPPHEEHFRAVDSLLLAAVRDSAFPAAQIAVVRKGVLLHEASFGTYTYATGDRSIDGATVFDLASVSKVVGTTTAVMKLVDDGRVTLDDRVVRYLPRLTGGGKDSITVRHLLLHRGGFPSYRRFVAMCRDEREVFDSIYATRLVAPPGDSTIYSDIGMMLLGKVIERICGMTLAEFLREEFFVPLGMRSTMYTPPPLVRMRAAPTERDTVWRHAVVRGTVHDENAALLGGVAGHAGLFSTASDLAVFVQMLMNGGTYGGRRYVRSATVDLFVHTPGAGGRFLGWDRRAAAGSTAGDLFSERAYGHTGFTGTSIWVDPEDALAVILLTNRIHPTRANMKIANVRPLLHDAVVRAARGLPVPAKP